MKTPTETYSSRPSAIKRIKKQRRAKKYQTKKENELEEEKHSKRVKPLRQPKSAIKRHLEARAIGFPEEEITELTKTWKSILKYSDTKKKITIENRIAFWVELASAKYPLFEKKASNIRQAGKGVFVTNWYPYCPKGAMLPFVGEIQRGRPATGDCIAVGTHCLALTPFEEPTIHFGNFVNNPIRSGLDPEEYNRRAFQVPQRLDIQNCKLEGQIVVGSVEWHTLRMEVMKALPPGTELLGPYGRAYQAGHRSEGFAVSSSDPPTPHHRPADHQPRWPEWSSRT